MDLFLISAVAIALIPADSNLFLPKLLHYTLLNTSLLIFILVFNTTHNISAPSSFKSLSPINSYYTYINLNQLDDHLLITVLHPFLIYFHLKLHKRKDWMAKFSG
jgi:hypothetical protein